VIFSFFEHSQLRDKNTTRFVFIYFPKEKYLLRIERIERREREG
jgi:hypothetical protein